MALNKKKPNPIDIHVGSRVRMRRLMLGVSQEKLAEHLGITFQQVQKYEKGTNRIGASRLQHIAQILDAPIGFFFEDCPSTEKPSGFSENTPTSYMTDFLSTSEGLELVRTFQGITDPTVRKRVIELMRAIASKGPGKLS